MKMKTKIHLSSREDDMNHRNERHFDSLDVTNRNSIQFINSIYPRLDHGLITIVLLYDYILSIKRVKKKTIKATLRYLRFIAY